MTARRRSRLLALAAALTLGALLLVSVIVLRLFIVTDPPLFDGLSLLGVLVTAAAMAAGWFATKE